MPRKYPIESVKTVSDLLNIFGARFLERGIVLSEQIEIHPEGDLVYSTTVNGYHVVFDGQRLPGQTSCECMAATKWPYCKHMAALAVLLVGDGELPRLAKQMGTHKGQHALVDELDENELRELIHAILDLSKDAESILTKRLETKAVVARLDFRGRQSITRIHQRPVQPSFYSELPRLRFYNHDDAKRWFW